jgi:hypothetical protein
MRSSHSGALTRSPFAVWLPQRPSGPPQTLATSAHALPVGTFILARKLPTGANATAMKVEIRFSSLDIGIAMSLLVLHCTILQLHRSILLQLNSRAARCCNGSGRDSRSPNRLSGSNRNGTRGPLHRPTTINEYHRPSCAQLL